ncbi:FAD/FMN-containing isoamyl alcohol oxidase MreA, partial [Aureobasidium melanogenum]
MSRSAFKICISAVCLVLATLQATHASPVIGERSSPSCRVLPGDAAWPNQKVWDKLNQTVGGRLIRGAPLAQPCYTPDLDISTCTAIQNDWTALDPFLRDPVNVMSPYWMNDSCSPFLGPNGSCTLANLASYAINMSCADDAIAGVAFAQNNNIRLTIKNTGHDFLGRSAGKGSLALWTHNMKQMSFVNYESSQYTGPAFRVGAGITNAELYAAAGAKGYRAVGGSCPTVGATGGYAQGGGHGPLGAKYGLGSDQVLEWELVTAAGKYIVASPTQNSDLYWALSGGGPGNLAVVLSMTVKVYKDGPIAGASLSFANTNDSAYWKAVSAWLKHLLVLDKLQGFTTLWGLTALGFEIEYATYPDANEQAMTAALAPFVQQVKDLNLSLTTNSVSVHANFPAHYAAYATQSYDTNNSIGGRLISRSVVQNDLPALIDAFRNININSTNVGGSKISGIAANVTHQRVGNTATANSVLPAWRDSLFTMTIGIPLAQDATWAAMQNGQRQLNAWQDLLRTVTPGGGTYMSEATYDNPNWKPDYFGANYQRLLSIKNKYDPQRLFWVNTAVGSDDYWRPAVDGRLCRV